MSANLQRMYDGAYIRLAFKLIAARIEVRQIDKVAKLLGQLACER